ncbi:Retrovirus-related Pol polyprotein from transposon RE1 [Vitis vinifera]|uniref:Retrovirus-related Pol polyprotein from transposon RE1 n=1 Tax=Vitis vinifera TaxID=29760 RepID=A0A438G3P2_VITVI|nr:Retrovirus-related Pol polyprotein from transposon RE1 [Vitis vinifera]
MTTKNQIFTSVISGSPMITSEKLVGSENYLSWSASVELWFMGQGYEDHLVTQEADIPEAKGLYTNDIQRLYKVASAIVRISQQDLDLSTYIGQIASLKEEFLTVMPLTPDVGLNKHSLTSSSWFLLLLASVRILSLSVIRFLVVHQFRPWMMSLEEDAVVPEVEANVLIATYCNKLGHTRDRCYQLHGRPPRTAHMAQSSDSPLPQPPSSSASQTSQASIASVAQPGNASACLTHTSSLGPWILDSGASDHLSGIGLALPLPSLPLTSDRSTGKTIGIGRESQGLYHLTSDSSPAVCISTDAPLLIHNRLGHPSLSKFQKMVPRFSTLSSLPCESCQLGKHTRVSFPKRLNNRAKSHFELVHTDDKLSAKAMKCLFLGYSRLRRVIVVISLETHRYFISADVTFFEDSPFFSTTSESLPVSEVLPIPIVSPPDAMPLDHFRFIIVALVSLLLSLFLRHLLTHFLSLRLHLPRLCLLLMTYPLLFGKSTHEALSHPGWRQAMVDEMAALHSNGTWDLVVLPSGKSTVGCRWVYAVKVGPDGQVDRLKARLVAKGYTQVYGSDYGDTFSPVAKIASVRLLLSMAAMCSWPLYQLDIKNAFLHGDLAEEVYMEQTSWFCCSGGVWFSVHTADDSVFYHHNSLGQCIYLVVYVDDIVITGSDQDGIQKLKQHLFTHFQTKDLGKLKYFLGIEIAQSSSGVVISQRKYALDILTGGAFRRPWEISTARSHWDAVIRILRYIKSTPGQGVLYENRGHTQVVGYTDADWAGSPTDRRSTSGYCVFIGGNLISWKSKKQDVVARSSAEAEYRAMALATCELIWLRHLLQELRFGKDEQMKLICDNQAALHIASNPVFHERTKHIEVDCHFIREKIASGCVATSFVNSNDQLADIFTKSLRGPRIKYICNKLGAYDVYAPA